MAMWTCLANDNGFNWPIELIIVVVLVVISGLKTLYDKVQEAKARQQQQEQPASQPQAERPESQPQSVEEIVRTMRQARKETLPTMQPSPVPTARQAQPIPQAKRPQQARQSLGELSDRHVTPTSVGQRVTVETQRLQSQLKRKRRQSSQRVAGEQIGMLTAAQQEATQTDFGVQVDLGDIDEARKGIILSEILGSPVALRQHRGMWDM